MEAQVTGLHREVLIVEDNPVTRRVLRHTLQKSGFRVREAENGATALSQLRQQPSDLVLLDLVLPDTHGTDLVKQIRAMKGGGMPVVACSGSISGYSARQLLGAGFSDFLEKPVEPARLVQVIRSYLPSQPRVQEIEGRGRKLLLVDEDDTRRLMLQRKVASLGFLTQMAVSFRETVDLLRQDDFFAVIADVQMPEHDGFDLITVIRNLPNCGQLPVVLLSSVESEPGVRELALQLGATDLVFRSPSLQEVEDALLQLTGPRPAPQFGAQEPPSRSDRAMGRLLVKLESQLALNANLSRRNMRQTAQLDILVTLSQAILYSDPGEVLREILAILIDTEGFASGAVKVPGALISPDFFTTGGDPYGVTSLFESVRPLVLQSEGRGVMLSRREDPDLHLWEGLAPSIQSLMAVPLVVRSSTEGVLLVTSEGVIEQQPESALFVRGVASQIELALALRQSLQEERSALEEARARRQEAEEQALLLRT
ncbi:MAG: response regulator, partial [Polyangiaceae bacterium]|nr:response regulator [Polyangiaceae bacterium]